MTGIRNGSQVGSKLKNHSVDKFYTSILDKNNDQLKHWHIFMVHILLEAFGNWVRQTNLIQGSI
jgi:hypothetical protein